VAEGQQISIPVTASDPDGQTITWRGWTVRVVATPGHTSDSVSLALPGDHALLTGDTVPGRGPDLVAFDADPERSFLALSCQGSHERRGTAGGPTVQVAWIMSG